MKKKISIVIIIIGVISVVYFAPNIHRIYIKPFIGGYKLAGEELDLHSQGLIAQQNEIVPYCAFSNQTIYMVHWYPRVSFGLTPEKRKFQNIWRSGFSLRCKRDGYKLKISEYNTPFPHPDLEPMSTRTADEWTKQNSANQQVDPIVTTPVDEVEAQSTQAHP